MQMKILVGSPVRQKANILNEFLKSLSELDTKGVEVHYFFVDDNTDVQSKKLLADFEKNNNHVIVKSCDDYKYENADMAYVFSSSTHGWKEDLIKKITIFKNDIISYARENNFDALFFVDSDIVLSKPTLLHLVSLKKDIVSELFWSQWVVGAKVCPQVWVQDDNKNFVQNWDEHLLRPQKVQAENDFFAMLKVPGTYKVGGLGACTLISQKALKAGVSFEKIDNLSFWGEDRHFCIRASALGFDLFVDTHYPAYHIYRECYLNRVEEFKKDGFKLGDMCCGDEKGKRSLWQRLKYVFYRIKLKFKGLKKKIKFAHTNFRKAMFRPLRQVSKTNKVVLSMVVKNEEGRYLEKMLASVLPVVDEVLIIDDASTDGTVALCEKLLKNKPHKIIKNEKSMLSCEWKLRKMQWKQTLKLNPDWILNLDADEVFEPKFVEKLPYLLKENSADLYNFRYFDMWDNENTYRSDALWHAHKGFMPALVRYQKRFCYRFKHSAHHCGRFPKNIRYMDCINSPIRIKHLGWLRKEDREKKFQNYLTVDKNEKCGNMAKYQSIMDENPHLVKFEEE